MAQNITEEQKQQLQSIAIFNGISALEYVLQQPEDSQYWVATGILSLQKKGRPINRLTLFWEFEDLRNLPEIQEKEPCYYSPSKELMDKLTEEQIQQIHNATLKSGLNAWDYVLAQSEEDQPWIAAGILSCMKKGYSLNRLTINWEARELRYANAADCAQRGENQIPILTEKQQQLLQQTALTDGTNAWEWVMQQREVDRPWAEAGILSCIDKGYNLNEAMICWEARELRYKNKKRRTNHEYNIYRCRLEFRPSVLRRRHNIATVRRTSCGAP